MPRKGRKAFIFQHWLGQSLSAQRSLARWRTPAWVRGTLEGGGFCALTLRSKHRKQGPSGPAWQKPSAGPNCQDSARKHHGMVTMTWGVGRCGWPLNAQSC